MWSDIGLPDALVIGWFAVFGAVLGSFLNVCILRWGAEPKQSVMHPPSRCPVCGHAIRWYENVPIISWLVLRGRCSGCGTRISPMYPLIEATTALLWGGSIAVYGLGLSAIELAVAATLLLGIAVSDARAYIIPHEFSLGGTAIALAFAAWPHPVGMLDALQGALFGAGLVLLVGELTELALGQEAMGGGDCALMGMVGAFFGWESVWPVMGLGAFVGIVLHVMGSLRQRPAVLHAADEAPRPALRWGKLAQLIAGGLVLAGLLGVAAWTGSLGGVVWSGFFGTMGAGAAYYVAFILPKRFMPERLTQVWGLLGAGVGIALGPGTLIPVLVGVAICAGSVALAARRTVEASPDTTEELSAQGYLPFGVGLSIAAVVLAYSGGIERVREIFAELGPGLGL